jgi:hypothetical protein
MPVSPLKITGDQTTALQGTAPAGATLEAIDLTHAATNHQAIDEFESVGTVGSNGKFSLPMQSFLSGSNVSEGDYVRLRAKTKDGKSVGVVTVRIHSNGATDKDNAPFVAPRLAVYPGASGQAIVTADDPQRPVSEPFAQVSVTNTRTSQTTQVKLDKDGRFPTGFSVAAQAGDVLAFAVSDGSNNKSLAARAATFTVVGKAAHPNDIPDPDAHHDQKDKQGHLKVGMKQFTGPLFVNGATPGDIGQQYLGDCFLPAALGSLVKLRPDIIANMIKDNGDGTYTATFKDYSGGKWVSHAIKLDADLYVDGDGNPVYGAGLPVPSPAGPTMELWFPLLEKAYAQWKGSYEDIGNGGSPADVLSASLGRKGVEKDVKNANDTWTMITNALDAKTPAAFCTSSSAKRYENTGLHEDHCYSILDYRTVNGKREVQLRNPWGYDEPGNDGNDDGIFWYPIEDCAKMFTTFFSVA